jgi:hypothetical protein
VVMNSWLLGDEDDPDDWPMVDEEDGHSLYE